jgi:hypothetical protein
MWPSKYVNIQTSYFIFHSVVDYWSDNFDEGNRSKLLKLMNQNYPSTARDYWTVEIKKIK